MISDLLFAQLRNAQMAQELTREELLELIAKEKQRADDEKQRGDNEKQRADDEKQRADRLSQGTTLFEYIDSCHELVFSKVRIQTDKRLTTKGLIPAPLDKWCPEYLKPWAGFIDLQRTIAGILVEAFPPAQQARVYETKLFLAGLGDRMFKRPIRDEKTLEYVLHSSVEDPVRVIIDHLQQLPADHIIHQHFDLGDGIVFENHPLALSELSSEVMDAETAQAEALPSTPPGRGPNLNQLRPDQICIYRADRAADDDDDDDDSSEYRAMVYVCEYKPPHKLTAAHLRLGLRPMHIPSEVVRRGKLPADVDLDTKFAYYADLFTASAVTQIYHYMIEAAPSQEAQGDDFDEQEA
jgi:hypothetical protein